MSPENVNACMQVLQPHLSEDKVLYVRGLLSNSSDACKDTLISMHFKSSKVTLVLAIFLGGLGIDRFYVGDIGLGVAKLLVGWMTCGIWWFIDIFISHKKAKVKNLNTIRAKLF